MQLGCIQCPHVSDAGYTGMITAGKDRGEVIAQLQGVDFSYGANTVLEGVDLTVRRGDYLAVLGPNGGGKTTLVKLILGLIRPDTGQVRVFDAPPAQTRGSIGYVPQYTNIRPDFPVSTLDVVLMGLATSRSFGLRASSAERDKAMEALALVDMADCADRRIGALSGGQRQRVFIARALASGPDLLLMDEPTASVDAHARFCFYELLAELSDRVSVVVVSHDLSIVASRVTAIACVNKRLHYHPGPELTTDMLELMYGGHDGHKCPVMAFAHGLPGIVVPPHGKRHA